MRRARVLVLEHHRDLREALVEALLDEGYLVTPAATVAAALIAIRGAGEDQLPDAIVLDAQDGHDLVAAVRANESFANVALVTLSFAFDPPTGTDVDVRRPFRLEDFLNAVHTALRRHGFPPDEQHLHPGA